jgi:hypothetical protein
MAVLAPPPAPPRLTLSDSDGLRRFQQRVFQVMASVVTVLAAGWVCTYGAIPAILSLMVAKHILVAILIWGLDVDGFDRRR